MRGLQIIAIPLTSSSPMTEAPGFQMEQVLRPLAQGAWRGGSALPRFSQGRRWCPQQLEPGKRVEEEKPGWASWWVES